MQTKQSTWVLIKKECSKKSNSSPGSKHAWLCLACWVVKKICLPLEMEFMVCWSHLPQEEIYMVCKFPYAKTCIKGQCQQQKGSGCLLQTASLTDRQNEQFYEKYSEEGLWPDLIFVNCVSELRLPIVRSISLLVLGLVTTSYFGTMAKVQLGSDILKPFSSEGDVVVWLKEVGLVTRLQQVDDVVSLLLLCLEGDALAVYMEMKEED